MDWVKKAARVIAIRLMKERSGTGERMTLEQWEAFIEKAMRNAYQQDTSK